MFIPKEENKKKWQFRTSIFKDWKEDDEQMIDKCFENDWGYGRFKIVKDPEDLAKVKELFRKIYR